MDDQNTCYNRYSIHVSDDGSDSTIKTEEPKQEISPHDSLTHEESTKELSPFDFFIRTLVHADHRANMTCVRGSPMGFVLEAKDMRHPFVFNPFVTEALKLGTRKFVMCKIYRSLKHSHVIELTPSFLVQSAQSDSDESVTLGKLDTLNDLELFVHLVPENFWRSQEVSNTHPQPKNDGHVNDASSLSLLRKTQETENVSQKDLVPNIRTTRKQAHHLSSKLTSGLSDTK